MCPVLNLPEPRVVLLGWDERVLDAVAPRIESSGLAEVSTVKLNGSSVGVNIRPRSKDHPAPDRLVLAVRDPRATLADDPGPRSDRATLNWSIRWSMAHAAAVTSMRRANNWSLLLRYEDWVRRSDDEISSALCQQLCGELAGANDRKSDDGTLFGPAVDRRLTPTECSTIETTCWREMVEFGYVDLNASFSRRGWLAGAPTRARVSLARRWARR